MAQRPLIYIKPRFLPTCPSENILLFWTMHKFCTGYNYVGWVRFFSLSTETIKSICEEIFKVDRNKHWQAAGFLAGVWIAGDGGLFPWRDRERNTHFLVFVKPKVLTKYWEIYFPGVIQCVIDYQQCVDFRSPELDNCCTTLLVIDSFKTYTQKPTSHQKITVYERKLYILE